MDGRRPRARGLVVPAVLIGSVLLASACQPDVPETAPVDAPPAFSTAAFDVYLVDLAFVPEQIELHQDTEEEDVTPGVASIDPLLVRWSNRDDVEHTVTFEDVDLGVLTPGAAAVRSFADADPGEYPYRCTIHPDIMTGTITVLEG